MTRKEAIKALKWFKEYNEEDYCGGDRIQDKNGDWYYYIAEQDFEAFDMAIKALEQEPSGDDVVSRDVVKEQMIMYGFHAPDMTVTEFVEDLPSVNLKEPTTKNNLGVDVISRKAVDDALYDYWHDIQCVDDSGFGVYQDSMEVINNLPSVTPQEPNIKSLGNELRSVKNGINDEKVLIGYNLAVAICNKYLGKSEG